MIGPTDRQWAEVGLRVGAVAVAVVALPAWLGGAIYWMPREPDPTWLATFLRFLPRTLWSGMAIAFAFALVVFWQAPRLSRVLAPRERA
jgi:hypothetical protein